MSHYMKVKTQLHEQRFILAALAALGLPCEVAEPGTRLHLNGWLDDSAADVVVRKENLREHGYTAHADLGFWQAEHGYEILMDDYDLNRYGGRESLVQPLEQQYQKAFALDWAQEYGFDAEVVTLDNGDIQVVTTRW